MAHLCRKSDEGHLWGSLKEDGMRVIWATSEGKVMRAIWVFPSKKSDEGHLQGSQAEQ